MLKVYEYSKCSTCKKALKFLDSQGVDYKKVDITENPPSKAELKRMLKSYDGELKRLFNTSGVVYREMKLSEKVKNMTASEAIDLLASNGRLIKRPFVLSGSEGAVGFKPDEWKQLL
jgi:arsenate reductase